jgi:hypothetical protein
MYIEVFGYVIFLDYMFSQMGMKELLMQNCFVCAAAKRTEVMLCFAIIALLL